MNETEYKKLRKKIEGEYHEGIKALEKVWHLSNPGEPLPCDGDRPDRGELIKVVRECILSSHLVTEEFSMVDVESTIRTHNPTIELKPASLRSTLKRLVGTDIEVVKPGSGKRGSSYRVLKSATTLKAVN